MSQPAHSKLGASKAARWLACPGSVALCATLPEPPTSEYARRGTAAHTVAEKCLDGGHEPYQYTGASVGGVTLTKADTEAVAVYVEHCRELREHSSDWWIEHRFALDKLDAALFGTVDFCTLSDDACTLTVVDYKHGAGVPVAVENNPQLQYYGLGALLTLPAARNVDTVQLHVVQPRAAGEPIKRWAIRSAELFEFATELALGAAATREPNAPLNPGDHCRFCPARAAGKCPALQAAAEAVVLDEFSDATQLDAAAIGDRLPELLAKAALAKSWARAIEQLAYREAIKGAPLPGYKLVAKRTTREWANPASIASAASATFGKAMSAFYTMTPVSPAGLEKLVGRAESAAWIKERLAPPKAGYSLVPETDKRPAVPPPGDDFLDVSEFGDDDAS